MTPFEISILIHYYTSPRDFRNGDFDAPLLLPTLERFVEQGLLARVELGEPNDAVFKPTEATYVFVNALCAVPAPVQRWVIDTSSGSGSADNGND